MSIGEWMETPNGKVIMGYAFGFGAAIVIVGALFKIQHWPGSSYVLTAGMGVEALLFALSAFSIPHPTYHWDQVFPQLAEHDDEGLDAISSHSTEVGHGNAVAGSGASSNASLSSVPAISDEDVKLLSEGISKLTENAKSLASLSSVVGVTEDFVKNISSASNSVSDFAKSQSQINSTSEALVASYQGVADNISAASQSTTGFIGNMNNVAKSLSSINSIYEIQLKEVTEQSAAQQGVSSEIAKLKQTISAASQETESYKAETAKLTQQVASLNNVYGSMLNALNA